MTQLTRATRRAAAAPYPFERRVEAVSARFLSPPTLFCVGTLCVLLAFGAVVAGMTRVPSYVSGPALILEHDSRGAELVVFLPSESLPQLRPGQKLLLRSDDGSELKPRSVAAVEPRLAGSAFIQERLASTRHPRNPGMRSVAVATAQLEPTESAIGCSSSCDAICSARIEVGSQRAIFLVPFMRRWLAQEDL